MSIIRDHAALILNTSLARPEKSPKRRYWSPLELLIAEGTDMVAIVDTEFPLGKAGEHYKNAAVRAISYPNRFLYVEGLAIIDEDIPLPVPHAWAWDMKNNQAVEITWDTPGVEYLGVPITKDFLLGMARLRGRWGILDHKIMLTTEAKPQVYRANILG